MSVFMQPPFWAAGARPGVPHAVSVIVQPPDPDGIALVEPLTLQQAKDRAGFTWADGDPREDLLLGFISAARSLVEQRTGLALPTQVRDVYFDALPIDRTGGLRLPPQSLPLQQVISVKSIDTSGVVNVLDPSNYFADLATARIGLSPSGTWPMDLRPMQPWVVRIKSGWATPAALRAVAPMLFQAVGLLTAHYATLGRDLASLDPVSDVPFGFEDLIEPYCLVTVP